MRPFDLLSRDRKQNDLPRLAGGAHQPGDRLCADLQYMNDREAETISGMVKTWREMPHDEHAAALRGLNS